MSGLSTNPGLSDSRHWVDGSHHEAEAACNPEATASIFNPAEGKAIGAVPLARNATIDRAVKAASSAFKKWRRTSIAERTQHMFRLRQEVAQRAEELAQAITVEHGKVLSDARGEVARGLDNIDYACGVGELLKGSYSSNVSRGVDVHNVREPLGVVAGITPFNFPVMVPLWMVPTALACGNTFVLKPSEKDPSAPTLLGEILHDAGFPAGVFNVVHGDQTSASTLIEHPDVAAISFVGSTAAARSVHSQAAQLGKRVQALGGAKNHMVVLPDARVARAADAAVSAAFGSAGERCMAVSVVVAVGEAADPLVHALKQRASTLVIGRGNDPRSQMGPLITREHRDRVASMVGAGVGEGCVAVLDGRQAPTPGEGFFLGATVLDRVEPHMAVYQEEIFGPVLCVVRVQTLRQAIELINANRYGNGVALFTESGAAARRFQQEVEVGMVGINVPIPVPVGYHSFGGWNDSLFGSHHMYGPEGFGFFTRAKTITSRWPEDHALDSEVNLAFPSG